MAKPTVCKTVTHRFESGRRLQIPLLSGLLALLSCADPAAPPEVPGPPDLPRWSEAPYVEWSGPSSPVSRPLAVFVDLPGGPMDAIAADLDVTTFLNDRFHPWFLRPDAVDGLPPAPLALILDRAGCVRAAPFRPEGPAAWIAAANAVLLDLDAGRAATERLPELRFDFPIAADHPLFGRCAASERATP